MQLMLDEVIEAYPEDEKAPDRGGPRPLRWLRADPERAAELDAAELRERAAKRAAKAAEKRATEK